MYCNSRNYIIDYYILSKNLSNFPIEHLIMQNQLKSIPVFLLEEDNETFLIWQYARLNNIIYSKNNTLLHIDEHVDMSIPRLCTSILDLGHDMEAIINFSYNELGINSYIIPAIYLGIFDKVHWIKYTKQKKERIKRKRIVKTINNEGKKFLVFNPNKNPVKNNEITQKFLFTEDTFDSIKILSHHNLVLNINLNYFACIKDPGEAFVNCIEITEAEYLRFEMNKKYHPLKYLFLGNKIDIKKEYGKYYYIINDHKEVYIDARIPSKEKILEEIKMFVHNLLSLNANFQLISITRSRYSGYTPKDISVFIEEELLKELSKNFPIKTESIDQLIERLRSLN